MTPPSRALSGEISAPAAMRARGTVAAMPAVVTRAMAVEGVAAKRTYAATDERTGQRVAVKGGGEASTGHSADGTGGKYAMFTRAAGREAEAEQADKAERDEAAHMALLCGLVWPGGSPFGELALC